MHRTLAAEYPSSSILKQKFDVAIIGGGIIGASTAYALSKRGKKVILIEKGSIASECSYGNAGWLTPCFAQPLALPGMIFKASRWLLDPESPFRIQPRFSLGLVRWLIDFLSAANHKKAAESRQTLVELSLETLRIVESLPKEVLVESGFYKQGLLMVSESRSSLESGKLEAKQMESFGIKSVILNKAELASFEPALRGNYAGAVYFPNEAHVEPAVLTKQLVELSKKNGTIVLEGTEVLEEIASTNKLIWDGLKTTLGNIHAEQFVVCTGVGNSSYFSRLEKSLGLRLPILGGKGYGLIFDQKNIQLPSRPVMLVDRKLALTPRKDTLRAAGTLELVDKDLSVSPRRVKAMVRGMTENLFTKEPQRLEDQSLELWRGLRPCTPDGVPMLGRVRKLNNVYVNMGHQMLGLQTGAGSGETVAKMICKEPLEGYLNPKAWSVLDPNRF